MVKNKWSELTASLTTTEQKQFSAYLQSPYFQCSKEVAALYAHLLDDPHVNKEKLYTLIFSGRRYDDKRFRYLVSEFNDHLTRFFTLKYLDHAPLTFLNLSAKALARRDCEKAYNYLHLEILKKPVYQDAGYFLEQFGHAEQHLNYSSGKMKRKATPDFSDTLNNLDIFYVAKKLQLNCEVVNLSNILKKNYQIHLSNEIKKIALQQPFCDVPVIRIYYHILETLSASADESHFIKVTELLNSHGSLFPPGELGEMYQYIKNYCVRKLNQGNTSYVRRLFDIYVMMLSNKQLMRHDWMSQWEFKNIVTISLRLNEKKWCEHFIERYITYLRPSERKNALAYNMAYSLFMNGEYRKAIRKLQEVELTDVFYQLDARVILLKCYYELDEYDTFIYHASAFRLFLLRNRTISDYQKTINRNLIKFLSAIMRSGYSKARLRRIKSEIEKEKNVADLTWLMSKIGEAGVDVQDASTINE